MQIVAPRIFISFSYKREKEIEYVSNIETIGDSVYIFTQKDNYSDCINTIFKIFEKYYELKDSVFYDTLMNGNAVFKLRFVEIETIPEDICMYNMIYK